jgi:hypothetical protein
MPPYREHGGPGKDFLILAKQLFNRHRICANSEAAGARPGPRSNDLTDALNGRTRGYQAELANTGLAFKGLLY